MIENNLKPQINIKNSSPLSDLSWTENNELVTLEFNLNSEEDRYLSPDYSKGLHAWFLEEVRKINPELSKTLHDDQTEKAFSLSRLQGDLETIENKIFLKKNSNYQWYLSVLSRELVQWLKLWLSNPPSLLELKNNPLQITAIKIANIPTTYQQLLEIKRRKNYCLTFISPTSFRRKGHHFPLPLPVNLFHSYLRRWNDFAEPKFSSSEFLDWIDENVIILRHNIETHKVPGGKRGAVTGFIGAIELSLGTKAEESEEFWQLYSALCQLAPYCGTGHKTTFGLGHTKLGWLINDFSNLQPTTIESQLADRIQQLTEIFMKQKKRQGGERGFKISETMAQILARRELGESLKNIAIDLEIPYETAKTYSKRSLCILKKRTISKN